MTDPDPAKISSLVYALATQAYMDRAGDNERTETLKELARVAADALRTLSTRLTELQDEYDAFRRDVECREETFALAVGRQMTRAEKAEYELRRLTLANHLPTVIKPD